MANRLSLGYAQQTSTSFELAARRSQYLPPIPSQWRSSCFPRGVHPSLLVPIHPLGAGNRPRDNENNRLWRLKQKICDERAREGYQPALSGMSKADTWLHRINVAWNKFHGSDGTRIDARLVDTQSGDDELLADLFVMRGETIVCPIDRVSAGEIELLSFAGWIILNDFKGGLLL